MIKALIIGNLGSDATVNTVNGKNVINFSVAHTERYKDAQGAPQSKTTWVDVAYWTSSTAIAPYLKKGTTVYVEGTPEVRSFQKKDGTTGVSLSLRAQSVQLVGGGTKTENPQGATAQPAGVNSEIATDLPF